MQLSSLDCNLIQNSVLFFVHSRKTPIYFIYIVDKQCPEFFLCLLCFDNDLDDGEDGGSNDGDEDDVAMIVETVVIIMVEQLAGCERIP